MQVLRTAIIGQGRSGRNIHGAYLSKDPERFRIVAVVDPLPERRERAQVEYDCETYTDYTALLKRDDLDLIVNASPSKFHFSISLALLEAGFPVLCEKPLAPTVAEVDRLIAASEQSGKTFAIFQQSRFSPAYCKIREVLASGVLGDIVQISIAFNGFSRRYDWQTLISENGGCLLNTGPHPLDQALQWFGTDSMPEVTCFMRRAISYGDAEDHVLLILQSPNRPLVKLEISSCCRYPGSTYHVSGTRGGLQGDTGHLEWEYYDPAVAPELALITTPIQLPDGTPAYCRDSLTWHKEVWDAPKNAGLYDTMSHAFYSMLYRTLTQGEPLEITPQQVRQQIAVMEACRLQNPHIYPVR